MAYELVDDTQKLTLTDSIGVIPIPELTYANDAQDTVSIALIEPIIISVVDAWMDIGVPELIMEGMSQDDPDQPMIFVIDRSQSDVDRAKQLRSIGWQNMTEDQRDEWLSGMKGCLNRSDLERIEGNTGTIGEMLGLDLQTVEDPPDIPDNAYFARLLENVAEVRSVGYSRINTPAVPLQPLNTYQKVNAVEHILKDVYEIFLENNNGLYYVADPGELYAGETLGIL